MVIRIFFVILLFITFSSLLSAIEYPYPNNWWELAINDYTTKNRSDYALMGFAYAHNINKYLIETYLSNKNYSIESFLYKRSDIIDPDIIFRSLLQIKYIYAGKFRLRIATGGLIGYKPFLYHIINKQDILPLKIKFDGSLYETYGFTGIGIFYPYFKFLIYSNKYLVRVEDSSIISIDESSYLYSDTPSNREYINERGIYSGINYKYFGGGVLINSIPASENIYKDTLYISAHIYSYSHFHNIEFIRDNTGNAFYFYLYNKNNYGYIMSGMFYDNREKQYPFIHSHPIYFDNQSDYGFFLYLKGHKNYPCINFYNEDTLKSIEITENIKNISLGYKWKKGYNGFKSSLKTSIGNISSAIILKDSTISAGITIRPYTTILKGTLKNQISFFYAYPSNRYYTATFDMFSAYIVEGFTAPGIYTAFIIHYPIYNFTINGSLGILLYNTGINRIDCGINILY